MEERQGSQEGERRDIRAEAEQGNLGGHLGSPEVEVERLDSLGEAERRGNRVAEERRGNRVAEEHRDSLGEERLGNLGAERRDNLAEEPLRGSPADGT